MTAKTKKNFIVAGASIVCVAMICVIASRFADDKNIQTDNTTAETEIAEIVTTVVTTTVQDEIEAEIPLNKEEKHDKPAETTARIGKVTEKEMIEVDRSFEEATKPVTTPPPPAVDDESALTNPATQPEYEPAQTTVTAAPKVQSDTPKHGETKNGKIYINGFGWVANDGGGTKGESAGDMYQNGNKIGSFG